MFPVRCAALASALAIAMMVVIAWTAARPPVAQPARIHRSTAPQFPTGLTSGVSPAERARAAEAYGKLPLTFEANLGQSNKPVKFLSRGQGYTLFLTGDEAVLSLRRSPALNPDRPAALKLADFKPSNQNSAVLRMKLVGANASAAVSGSDEQEGKSNYFIGNDPSQWRTNVSNYSEVRYQEAYPGIDLVYYGNQQQLEYDFVVAPGADPQPSSLTLRQNPLSPESVRPHLCTWRTTAICWSRPKTVKCVSKSL